MGRLRNMSARNILFVDAEEQKLYHRLIRKGNRFQMLLHVLHPKRNAASCLNPYTAVLLLSSQIV